MAKYLKKYTWDRKEIIYVFNVLKELSVDAKIDIASPALGNRWGQLYNFK